MITIEPHQNSTSAAYAHTMSNCQIISLQAFAAPPAIRGGRHARHDRCTTRATLSPNSTVTLLKIVPDFERWVFLTAAFEEVAPTLLHMRLPTGGVAHAFDDAGCCTCFFTRALSSHMRLFTPYTRLNGDFSANDLRRFLFPDLATPLVGLSVFGGLVLLLWLLSTLEVGKVLCMDEMPGSQWVELTGPSGFVQKCHTHLAAFSCAHIATALICATRS